MPHKDPIARKKYRAEYYKKNKAKLDKANSQWAKDHPREFRAIQKRYESTEKGKAAVKKKEATYKETPKHKVRIRKAHLKQCYGLSLEEYDEMVERQGGVCAICGKPETAQDVNSGTNRRLSVDHCHKTNEVRGLLCSKCNTGLGLFKDDITSLRSAINYLTTYVKPGA
jgi:hypothetical protein